MKNEMNEIPTPETNAFMLEYNRAIAAQKTRPSMWDKLQSLERRLTVARETLIMIADESSNLAHAERMADRALKQTAPKP